MPYARPAPAGGISSAGTTYPRLVDGTRDASSADAVDDHEDTAPQPPLTPEALAQAAAAAEAARRHERQHGAHAAPEGVVPGPVAPPVHHHEAEGGHASHLAPAHVLPQGAPRDRRRTALVAGSLAAVLLLVGGVAAWAAMRPSGSTAAPAPSVTPSATLPVAGDVDPTAAPGVPAAPLLPPGQDTLVLGDSLGLTVYPWLADLVPDRYVSYEAEIGRTTDGTITALEALPSIPPMVIVSSGTNDPTAAGLEAEAGQLLDILGPDRCVVWVDIVRPDSAYDSADDLNAALERAVAGRDNVSVLRWTTLIEENPGWMGGDGIHPTEAGAIGRAEAFANASRACSPTDPDAPVAKKQYIPLSEFYGPIAGGGTSGSGTGSTSTARPVATSSAPQSDPTDSGGGEATVSPDPAPSTSKPATTSAPPPPPPPPPSSPAAPQETQGVAQPAPAG